MFKISITTTVTDSYLADVQLPVIPRVGEQISLRVVGSGYVTVEIDKVIYELDAAYELYCVELKVSIV